MKASEIPYGSTLSYKELSFNVSQIIGKQNSYRAVGNALGKNPLIIIVPCHRIIKSNGELGYFSSGVEIKKALIGLEKEQKIKKI
jgi:O-6-methylguanine DNA methyltransferase